MATYIAFSNIAIEMRKREVTVEDMAKVIGVTPDTMRKKLARKSAIKLDEAVRIANECFPGCEIKVLFKELADEIRDIVSGSEFEAVYEDEK